MFSDPNIVYYDDVRRLFPLILLPALILGVLFGVGVLAAAFLYVGDELGIRDPLLLEVIGTAGVLAGLVLVVVLYSRFVRRLGARRRARLRAMWAHRIRRS